MDSTGQPLQYVSADEANFNQPNSYVYSVLGTDLWIPGAGRVRTLAAQVEDRGLERLPE